MKNIELVVIHCTELPDISSARVYGEKIHYDSGTGNCGHYYISKQGHIEQWVENNRIAHHVRGNNPNSIGIELDNLGRFPNWHITNAQIMYDPYPQAQVDALITLLKQLKKDIPSLKYITGHEDLDTRLIPSENNSEIFIRRKTDPGKMFPWEKIMQNTTLINTGSLSNN